MKHQRAHQWVADYLVKRRRIAGLTQREAASRIGVTQTWLARSESGARRIDVVELDRLAKLYGFEIGNLLPMIEHCCKGEQ